MKKTKNILLSTLVAAFWIVAGMGTTFAQNGDLSALYAAAREYGIEETLIQELEKKAGTRGLSNEQLRGILEPAISLAEKQLPSDLILNKALEGLSKQISPDRIISYLGQMEQSTIRASQIVDSWVQRPEIGRMISREARSITQQRFRDELIKAASRGIQQNISEESMQELFNEIGNDDVMQKASPSEIIAAVGILPDLGSTPAQSGNARGFIIRALKGGFSADELQKLPTAMNMAQQRSQLPAASVIEGVSRQMRNGIPAVKILQNLFNGNIGGGPPGTIPKGLENRPDNPGNQGQGQGQGNNGGPPNN